MRVQVLSPIVIDDVQHNRGEILDVESLTDIQLQSVHVIDSAPARAVAAPVFTAPTKDE